MKHGLAFDSSLYDVNQSKISFLISNGASWTHSITDKIIQSHQTHPTCFKCCHVDCGNDRGRCMHDILPVTNAFAFVLSTMQPWHVLTIAPLWRHTLTAVLTAARLIQNSTALSWWKRTDRLIGWTYGHCVTDRPRVSLRIQEMSVDVSFVRIMDVLQSDNTVVGCAHSTRVHSYLSIALPLFDVT